MKNYRKITCYENSRRLRKLSEFREQVSLYSSRGDYESDEVNRVQTKINLMMQEVSKIVFAAEIDTNMQRVPPPAVGGPIANVEVISNIFSLSQLGIPINTVINFLERSIGVYQSDRRNSLFRTFNPIWWIGRIAYIPFRIIGAAGFNATRVEQSIVGRLFVVVIQFSTLIATLLTIFYHLDVLDTVKAMLTFR